MTITELNNQKDNGKCELATERLGSHPGVGYPSEICKSCGKTKEEHQDGIWCYEGFDGQASSDDWSKFKSSLDSPKENLQ